MNWRELGRLRAAEAAHTKVDADDQAKEPEHHAQECVCRDAMAPSTLWQSLISPPGCGHH